MTLISLEFLLLVLITGIVYFAIPEKLKKYQWTVLLASGLFFYIYTCNKYTLYLLATVLSTYFGGRWLQSINDKSAIFIKSQKGIWSAEERKSYKKKTQSRKKGVVALILVFNFGILAALKYLGIIFNQAEIFFSEHGVNIDVPALNLILPLGISFYTFQAMGYIIDIYRKKVTAEKNFGKLTLFLTFFPQIIQGPIGIYSDLAHQLYEPHKFSYERFKSGALLIFWGLFKKLVIADRAAIIVTTIPSDYESYTGSLYLVTALVYAIQLYADFSGGIDICRGVADVYGITMAENFRRPYFSKSLTEYWHRWHITLGEWLRNYLFYPISLSKPFLNMGKKLKKVNKNLGKVLPTSLASLITFVVIGIWHGAEFRYVAFGLWNGCIIMLSSLMQNFDKKLCLKLRININKLPYKLFAMIRTFIMVLVGYYFDIATSARSAIYMMYKSVTDVHFSEIRGFIKINGGNMIEGGKLDWLDFMMIIFGAFVILIVSLIQEKKEKSIREILNEKNIVINGFSICFLLAV